MFDRWKNAIKRRIKNCSAQVGAKHKPNTDQDTSDYEQMGVVFPYDSNIIPPRVGKLLREKRYEIEEAEQIPCIIEEGERILEIGAGIGLVSTLCSRNKHTESLSIYEADPKLTEYLQRMFAVNGVQNTTVTNGILSNSMDGTARFYIREPFWGSSLIPGGGYKSEIDLPVISFNQALEELRPTLIVCDIEGGELELFEDADLTGVNKLFLEVHQRVLGRDGMRRLFDIFSSKGFHYDQYHSHKAVVLFSSVDRPPAR